MSNDPTITQDNPINHFIGTNLQEASNVADEAVLRATDGEYGDVIQAIYDCYEHLGKALFLARAAMQGVTDVTTQSDQLARTLYKDPETTMAVHEPGVTGD